MTRLVKPFQKLFSEQLLSMPELDSTEGSSNRKDSVWIAQTLNVASTENGRQTTDWEMYVPVWTRKAMHAKTPLRKICGLLHQSTTSQSPHCLYLPILQGSRSLKHTAHHPGHSVPQPHNTPPTSYILPSRTHRCQCNPSSHPHQHPPPPQVAGFVVLGSPQPAEPAHDLDHSGKTRRLCRVCRLRRGVLDIVLLERCCRWSRGRCRWVTRRVRGRRGTNLCRAQWRSLGKICRMG